MLLLSIKNAAIITVGVLLLSAADVGGAVLIVVIVVRVAVGIGDDGVSVPVVDVFAFLLAPRIFTCGCRAAPWLLAVLPPMIAAHVLLMLLN